MSAGRDRVTPRRHPVPPSHAMKAATTCGRCEAILVPEAGQKPKAGDYAQCPRCDGLNVFRADGSLRYVGGVIPTAEGC